MLEALVALLFTRAELMRIEVEEQQERLVANIMLLAAAFILFFIAIITLLLFIMLVLPESGPGAGGRPDGAGLLFRRPIAVAAA